MSTTKKSNGNVIQSFVLAMRNEFNKIVKDKAVFFAFIGASVIVSFLYTYIYSNEVITELPIAVVDADNTTHSRKLLRMIDGASQTKIYDYYVSLNAAKQAFQQSKVRGVVVVPNDFSKKLQRNEQPVVAVYADAAYMLYYKQIATAVKTCAAYMNAGIQLKKKSAQGNLPTQALDKVIAVKAQVVSLYNPSSGYATFIIPIVLVIIFQTTMLTAIGLIGGASREKKDNLVLPANITIFQLGATILGKAASYIILSLALLLIMLLVLIPCFNLPMRTSLVNVLIYMLPFFLSIVYLGISFNGLFKRREDVVMLIMFTSIPSMMLTGFSYPIHMIPKWIQLLSCFLPSTLGAKGFIALTQAGADISLMKTEFLSMWGLCVVYFILAVLIQKRLVVIDNSK